MPYRSPCDAVSQFLRCDVARPAIHGRHNRRPFPVHRRACRVAACSPERYPHATPELQTAAPAESAPKPENTFRDVISLLAIVVTLTIGLLASIQREPVIPDKDLQG